MRPTKALIHQNHLGGNWAEVKALVPPGTALCPAVKANAYGHGAVETARFLDRLGAEAFCIATVEEGLELRKAGIRKPLILLGSLQPDEVATAVEADLDFFVWTKAAVEEIALAARGRSGPVRVHLKVDTGMGRVGCRPEEAEDLAGAIVHSLPLELTGICTHFAAADAPGPLTVNDQMARFQIALDGLKARGWTPKYVHAANSGGILAWPATHFNMVRPGIVLYGYPAPAGPGTERFQPVMELISKVGYVKTVPAGTALSYGSRYVTSQETDVATIPLGYADGYRRSFLNRAPLIVGEKRFTVSGTVCMDQILVDVGPDSGVKAGDHVILFGPETPGSPVQPPTAADLADVASTISYEILCGISARVPRIFV